MALFRHRDYTTPQGPTPAKRAGPGYTPAYLAFSCQASTPTPEAAFARVAEARFLWRSRATRVRGLWQV